MARIKRMREPVQEPRLFITIGNQRPIDAEELGRFVRELGADYRRATGGRLVLYRLQLGSTFMELVDAIGRVAGTGIALSDAAERMAKFWSLFKKPLKDSDEVKAFPEPLPVEISASRLLDMTERSRGTLEISRDLKNQTETIKLSFPEVSAANKRAKARKKKKPTQKRLPSPDEKARIEHLTSRLSAHAGIDYNEMEDLVEVVVELLKGSGSTYLLQTLAASLEAKNMWEIAQIVRRHIDDGNNTPTTERN